MPRDNSLHCKRDGRVYQMQDGFTTKPIPFSSAKHNYTKRDISEMEVGDTRTFMPMYGNREPIYSRLVRLK